MSGQNIFPRAPSQKDTRTRRALQKLAGRDINLIDIPSTIILDTFLETAVVDLSLHTPDLPHVAGSWTARTASVVAQVQSDGRAKFDQNGHSGHNIWTISTDKVDGTFYATVNIPAAGDNASTDAGPCFRYQDANNYSLVTVAKSLGGFAIYEKAGGAFTQRAFTAFTVDYDTDYTIVAVLAGSTMTATVNDDHSISYNALSVAAGISVHGMRYAGGATDSYGYYIAPFKFTNP